MEMRRREVNIKSNKLKIVNIIIIIIVVRMILPTVVGIGKDDKEQYLVN